MRFVDRKSELAVMERAFKGVGFQFIPVYGRRRVGKTRLVQEFIEGKEAIYFLADSIAETEQLKSLGRVIGEHFRDTILMDSGFKDWEQVFRYMKEKERGRLVVIIDEFPYLVNSNRAVSSIFQKGIDEQLKHSNIFLILMGSSIGMMEKEVLLYKAPLYGRRTGSLEVREMPFDSLYEFFPRKSFDELMAIYAVFGMIPAYLEKVNPELDILENIRLLILEKGTFFSNEVDYVLMEELREPRNYFALLKAISQGKRKISEMINETGFEKSHVSRYVDILRSLGFVKKEIPVTEKNPEKSKQGLYGIQDKFFTFWFKYVFPNKSRIEIGKVDYVLKLIRGSLEQHLSQAYEAACREICTRMMEEGQMQFTVIGKWWSRNEEVDLVALDEETKTVYFGECKWSKKRVGVNVYEELVRKSHLVDWHNDDRTSRFMLFSKGGFTDGMLELGKKEDVLLLHGDQLYS
jgi:AAA+ ATPase superfamily predicted ATPase